MRPEDLRREAEEIDRELQKSPPEEQIERFWTIPKIIAAFLFASMIILMSIPYWGITHNPSPGTIPKITADTNMNFTSQRFHSLQDLYDYDISPQVRRTAITIVQGACTPSDICYAKALHLFVRDQIKYVSDPPHEYIQSPEETLLGGGDCEDQAILLAFLTKSIGIPSRVALMPGHAYTEIYLPEAPRRYKTQENWIPLDPTCGSCGFGEIPRENKGKKTGIIPI